MWSWSSVVSPARRLIQTAIGDPLARLLISGAVVDGGDEGLLQQAGLAWGREVAANHQPDHLDQTRSADELRDGSATQLGTKILYIGGSDGETAQDTVFVAQLSGIGNFDSWAEGPPLPEPRSDASVVQVSGTVYVLGGLDVDGAPTTTVFTLTPDPQTGERVDNGQHVMLGCYHETFAFLRQIGTEGGFLDPAVAPQGALVGTAGLLAVLKNTVGIRAKEADEFDGLDLAEHDIGAYPDFQQTTIKSYHLREA